MSFGQRIAEDEVDDLASYFVETDQWKRIYSGQVDVVYGPKGSGKSAIYSLLMARTSELFDRGIITAAAENPRGTPAFRDLVADPPASEAEFVALWKLYLLCLIAQAFREYGVSGADVEALSRARVTGVTFFDFKHGQTGVAPNAIELHPILAFRCLT